jgi:hypothetical protein
MSGASAVRGPESCRSAVYSKHTCQCTVEVCHRIRHGPVSSAAAVVPPFLRLFCVLFARAPHIRSGPPNVLPRAPMVTCSRFSRIATCAGAMTCGLGL